MNAQTPDLQAVVERQCPEFAERLAKLEKQNRRLKIAGAVTLVIVGAIMLASALGCGQRRPEPRALDLLNRAEEQMWRADGICNYVLPHFAGRDFPPALETPEELEAVLDKAAVLLKGALEIDPRLHRARLCLATVYLRAKKPAKAIVWAEAFHRARPQDGDGDFILIRAYVAAEKWDALIKYCSSLLAQYDEHDIEWSEIDPAFLTEMAAFAWFRKGDLKKAGEWATRAIDMDPERTMGYYIRADVQKASGDEAGYEKSLQTAQRLDREAKKKRLEMLELESSQSEQETEAPRSQRRERSRPGRTPRAAVGANEKKETIMWSLRRVSVLPLLFIIVAVPVAGRSLPEPVEKNPWSETVNGLSGRLLVAREKIGTTEYFQLTLEVRNVGNSPLALQTKNPFAFTLRVLDGAGKVVAATSVRIDLWLRFPQWAIVPASCYLGTPVSIQSKDGAAGSHLDITTTIWKLPAGRYRLTAEYASKGFRESPDKPKNVTVWQGKLVLPPVDVEIEPKE